MIQKAYFNETDTFSIKGGLYAIGETMKRGMVLAMSIGDDHEENLNWLDSTYGDSSKNGYTRGSCGANDGNYSNVESNFPSSSVIFSNLRFGFINSTFTPNEEVKAN